MSNSNSGKIFNYTKNYFLNQNEVKKFLDYYFADKEIKNKIVLDAGCRVGDYSIGLINKGAKNVYGIDLSEECINVAKKRFPNNKNLEFRQRDIQNLKIFKDSTFDIVICVGTIFYLSPEGMKKALDEFARITKPQGIILVLFHKKKGFIGNTARYIANKLPLRFYISLINNFSFLLKPFVSAMIGRKINNEYLKYDILLSLKGIYFGIPINIPNKFKIKTLTCENCSEKTTTSYKIKIPKDKNIYLDN